MTVNAMVGKVIEMRSGVHANGDVGQAEEDGRATESRLNS